MAALTPSSSSACAAAAAPRNAVKAILRNTTIPLTGPNTLTQGAGGLNGQGAVVLAAAVNSGTQAGKWWAAPSAHEASTLDGEQ